MLGNKKLLFDEIYEKTKDCGRVQFVKLLMTKERENQELKKQVENCYCNRTDCAGRIKDSKKYDSLVQAQEVQQKEFIKWIEDYLNLFDDRDIEEQAGYDMLEEILQKYKEMIGVSDEKK